MLVRAFNLQLTALSVWLTLVTSIPLAARDLEAQYARSDNMIPLQVTRGTLKQPLRSAQSSHVRRSMLSTAQGNDTVPLYSSSQHYYSLPVTIGTQTFSLLVDLGSADTWTTEAFFTCAVGYYGQAPQSECAMGNTFNWQYEDSSVVPLDGEHFWVRYADGDFAQGPMANVLMTIGDTTFAQEVGIAYTVAWNFGDNVTSGVLGLAYPNSTNKYQGTDFYYDIPCPTNSSKTLDVGYGETYTCNEQNYDSVNKNLAASLDKPYFAMALSRDSSNSSNGGSMTFGGIPDVSTPQINATGTYSIVPIEPFASDDTKALRYYVISIDGVTFPTFFNSTAAAAASSTSSSSLSFSTAASDSVVRRSSKPKFHLNDRRSSSMAFHPLSSDASNGTSQNPSAQFIIDSGDPFIRLPAPLSQAFNGLFSPPATRYSSYYPWTVNCTTLAYTPALSIQIKGESFPINPEDLIVRVTEPYYDYRTGGVAEREVCYSAVQDAESDDEVGALQSGATTNFLGQPFLKNVLMAVDLGSDRMAILSRPYYES